MHVEGRVRSARRSAVLGALLGLGVCAGAAVPAVAKVRVVHPHQSIQARIDAAQPGDTIVLRPAVYRESLQISTSRITLKGRGATLTKPKKPAKTLCNRMGPTTGICVVGKVKGGSQQAPPTVVRPVKGVRITHLRVRRFAGDGIFGFGTARLNVDHSKVIDNGGYGLFSNTSTGTRAVKNVAHGNGDAGLYFGDSPNAQVVARNNRSTGNSAEGILLRNASTGSVRNNYLSGNCAGILVLAGAPGPATDWSISGNRVIRNNRPCPGDPDEGEPPLSGIGIALVGAASTQVADNHVIGNRPGGPSAVSGGILVITQPGPGTPPSPVSDLIVGNVANNNAPNDLQWDGTGTGIKFTGNTCLTSQPDGLCR